MATIQFYIGKFMGAKTSMHGLVLAENEGLRFVLHDGKVEGSVLDEETETVDVHWGDIADLRVDHGMLESSLRIELRTPPLGRALPGLKGTTLALQVQQKDREPLDAFLKRALALQRGESDADVDGLLDDLNDFVSGI